MVGKAAVIKGMTQLIYEKARDLRICWHVLSWSVPMHAAQTQKSRINLH